MNEIAEASPGLDALVLGSILQEHHAGRDPLVTYAEARPCLRALGRGTWSLAAVKNLIVLTWTLNGLNTAPLSRFLEAADEQIALRRDRPNRKVAAIATARAARKPKPEAPKPTGRRRTDAAAGARA